MTDWGSSTSLITGAGQGMGKGLALAALAAGGDVVGWDLDRPALSDLVVAAEALPGTLRVATVDVSDRQAVTAAAAATGPVDILVNNAGVTGRQLLVDESPTVIERVMGVNAMALFWTTQAFLPAMQARNSGHLVTLASAAGLVPLARDVAYTASKHAAVGFHEAVRQELRQTCPGVRSTLVTPFFVNTGMFAGAATRFPWLLPTVEPDAAVAAILHAVEQDRRRLIMPSIAAASYLYQLMPAAISDFLLDQLGISQAMTGFHGRSVEPTADLQQNPGHSA
jgi:all-trans-retinol dehydrogenase (NAD+)